jgi:hypothetical protein
MLGSILQRQPKTEITKINISSAKITEVLSEMRRVESAVKALETTRTIFNGKRVDSEINSYFRYNAELHKRRRVLEIKQRVDNFNFGLWIIAGKKEVKSEVSNFILRTIFSFENGMSRFSRFDIQENKDLIPGLLAIFPEFSDEITKLGSGDFDVDSESDLFRKIERTVSDASKNVGPDVYFAYGQSQKSE